MGNRHWTKVSDNFELPKKPGWRTLSSAKRTMCHIHSLGKATTSDSGSLRSQDCARFTRRVTCTTMSASSPRTESGQHAIRLAEVSDADTLARLRYALRASTGRATEPKADFINRCSVWMRDHLENDAWYCWVAELDGQLSGSVWLQLVEKIPNPRAEAEHHGYITNFYVLEGARGPGIGSRSSVQTRTVSSPAPAPPQ